MLAERQNDPGGSLRVRAGWFCKLLGSGLHPTRQRGRFASSHIVRLRHLCCFKALPLCVLRSGIIGRISNSVLDML